MSQASTRIRAGLLGNAVSIASSSHFGFSSLARSLKTVQCSATKMLVYYVSVSF